MKRRDRTHAPPSKRKHQAAQRDGMDALRSLLWGMGHLEDFKAWFKLNVIKHRTDARNFLALFYGLQKRLREKEGNTITLLRETDVLKYVQCRQRPAN